MARKKEPPAQNNTSPEMQDKCSPMEQFFMEAHQLAKSSKLSPPKIKASFQKNGALEIKLDPLGFALLENVFATTSEDFSNVMLTGLSNAMGPRGNQSIEAIINAGLSLVAAIKPRDELEAMLAVQMAAVHSAVMTQSRRLVNSDTLPQLESNERALNKLARTFTAQMETLKRYRTGGEQKVTVHHVTVNEGGKAIVGTIQQNNGKGEG